MFVNYLRVIAEGRSSKTIKVSFKSILNIFTANSPKKIKGYGNRKYSTRKGPIPYNTNPGTFKYISKS